MVQDSNLVFSSAESKSSNTFRFEDLSDMQPGEEQTLNLENDSFKCKLEKLSNANLKSYMKLLEKQLHIGNTANTTWRKELELDAPIL